MGLFELKKSEEINISEKTGIKSPFLKINSSDWRVLIVERSNIVLRS